MNFLPFKRFKTRSIFYLIVGGFIPVIYIISLLAFNYQNNLALQESSTKRWKLDIEKQAAMISYFFLERKYDIRTIANSMEVMTYFVNRDMGMSEQYGLKVSLFSIHQIMQSAFRDKTIKKDSIYKNFAFINSDKKILVNMASPSQVKKDLSKELNLDAVKDEPKLIFEKIENGYDVLLAAPCFFKKKLSGWILAWIDLTTLHKNFVQSSLKLSSRISFLTLENGEAINSADKAVHDFPLETFQEKIDGFNDKDMFFISGIFKESPHMLVNRIKVLPMPLFLTISVSKKEILGHIKTWQYLAGTGALIFLLLFGLLLFVRADTKHLILETRLDESKKQHDLLTEKNKQLKEEISKRQKVERILKENEERYRKLFESSSDAILIVKKNRIIDCNRKTSELLALDHQEIINQNIDKFSPTQQPDGSLSDKKYLKLLDKSLDVPQFFEWTLKTKKNKLIETEINMTVLSLDSNKYIQVIIRDITERKQAEQEKIKAQKLAGEQKKLALIGQVAGKMAHDFNNILGIIMGNTELSLIDCKDAETKRTLELIFEQTLRGKNLTKNLVAFAKNQEPRQEFFKINETSDLVLNLLRKDLEGITIIKEDESNVPDLLADPGMIEHALVNFLQNSIHAVSMVKNPKIIVRSFCLNNNICFEIEDNGCGIPEESLDSIYEPSFTLKGSKDITCSYKPGIKGTGYGMSNIKKYIELHKGNISVASEFGSGTKFTVSLPIIRKELTGEEKKEIREEIVCFNKYILLVEDEQSLSDVQYRVLSQEPCNHRVDSAYNGQVAIDLFDRNEYDFVSLDYILPGGINGMDVYTHIRKVNKTIPILFISGNIEFLESIKDLKQNDANIDHLSKPCQNRDYVSSINKLLEKTSTGQ